MIVLAAGSGNRFGKPKQFLELTPGIRLVDAALETAMSVTDNVVLVLPAGHVWEGRPVSVSVIGGKTRLDSVAAGLSALPRDQEVVVIHQSAHPLAPKQTFLDVIGAIRNGADAAVPLLPVSDVVKREGADGHLTTVGRDGFGLAQMPMGFSAVLLMAAHIERDLDEARIWEESMLVERAGGRVVGIRGSSMNVHVVMQEDLELARTIAKARAEGENEHFPDRGLR